MTWPRRARTRTRWRLSLICELRPCAIDRDGLTSSVKNLIKVFQLETVSSVEVDLPADSPDVPSSAAGPPLKALSSSSFMPVDAFFASGTLTKHTLRNAGTLRTLATLGTISQARFDSVSDSSLQVHHAPTRAALSEIFGRGPAPAPPPTPAKAETELEPDGLPTLEEGRKAMALLQALLPMAAHLIPLPGGDDGIEDHAGAQEESLAAVENVVDAIDAEVDQAREELITGLEKGELELIVSPFGDAGCACCTGANGADAVRRAARS